MNNSTKEINFTEKKWSEILSEVQKNKKFIFVDAFASWCGPCKLLKSQTFKDVEVASFFNDNFINVELDMEMGEGLTFARKWDITAYPTLLFFNPDGKLIMRQLGFVKKDKLLEIAKLSLSKM